MELNVFMVFDMLHWNEIKESLRFQENSSNNNK